MPVDYFTGFQIRNIVGVIYNKTKVLKYLLGHFHQGHISCNYLRSQLKQNDQMSQEVCEKKLIRRKQVTWLTKIEFGIREASDFYVYL